LRIDHFNETVKVSQSEVLALLLLVDLVVAGGQGFDGGLHQSEGVTVASADSFSTLDQVFLVWNSSGKQNSAIHLGRIEGPIGDANKGNLKKKLNTSG
jgi:hypothetical protein